MDLLSYGDSIPEGEYRLHSAFANALNFRKGKIIVTLVPPRTGAGPLNLVLKQLPTGAKRLRASRFYFYVDENRLRKEPEALYCSAIPLSEPAPETVLGNAIFFSRLLARLAPPKSLAFIFDPTLEQDFARVFDKKLLARLKKGIEFFTAGNYPMGARTLRGLGLGFTPSGDDFLCGLMAGYNYALANLRFDTVLKIELIFFNSEGKNIVSNSFLRASHEGKVNAKIGRLMKALGGKDKTELEAASREALLSGHTSGADFCAGLAFSLLEVLQG